MSLTVTAAQQKWVQARHARRVFTAEFPWHDGLPARHVATEPVVFNDPNHFFKIGSGSIAQGGSVNAITFAPLIAGETVIRQAISSHIFGDSEVERGVIEMELAESDLLAGWAFETWGGRPVILRWGDPRWERVIAFGTQEAHIRIMKAIVRGVRLARDRVIVEMVPDIALFDVIINSRFRGDIAQGVIPAVPEVDGDLVPFMLGHVAHAPAKIINSADLQYWRASLVSRSTDLEVRDNNVVLTGGVDYTQPDWEILDLDNAIGKITWSGTQHNFFGGSADPKELKHCMRLAFEIGETGDLDILSKTNASGQLFNLGSGSANSTLDEAMGGDIINVGLYVDSETPFVNALQKLADAAGLGFFIGAVPQSIDRANKAIFRRIEPPGAEPVRLVDGDYIDARWTPINSGGTVFNSDGVRVPVPDNTMRITHQPGTGEDPAVLREGPRTNIAWPSNDFTHGNYIVNATLTPGQATGPDGAVSMAQLVDTSSSSNQFAQGVWTIADDASWWCIALWVRLGHAQSSQYRLSFEGGSAVFHDALLNWATSTVIIKTDDTGTAQAGILEDLGDLKRIYIAAQNNASGNTTLRWIQWVTEELSGGAPIGDIFISDLQVENARRPSSDIITTTGPRNRTDDDYRIKGAAFQGLWRPELSLVCEFEALSTDGTDGPVSVDDGGGNNRIQMRHTAFVHHFLVAIGGVIPISSGIGSFRVGRTHRQAVRVRQDDYGFAADGGQTVTFTGLVPVVTQLQLGNGPAIGQGNYLIRSLVLSPAFNDSELQTASAVGRPYFTGAGTEAFRFTENNIAGGVQIEHASDAVPAVSVARRVSWANTAGDVIDPSLSPADKRELSALWKSKTYSLDASFDGTPSDSTTVRLELVDEASQDIEGHRLARIRQRQRNWYRFTALTGALQVQAGDQVGLAHDGAVVLGPLRDEQGQVIRDLAQQPVMVGKTVMIKALEESFPSGRVFVEAWA